MQPVLSDERILYTLCTELSWSHIRQLMFIDDKLKRDFYIEMCRMEHWSVRQLGDRIDSMLYERTAISKKPDETIAHDIELLCSEEQLKTLIRRKTLNQQYLPTFNPSSWSLGAISLFLHDRSG